MSTLTPRDIAADLNVSVYTATEHVRTGAIPGGFQIVTGGAWRIDEPTYRAWVAERVAEADPNRIAARSARSKAAQSRGRSA